MERAHVNGVDLAYEAVEAGEPLLLIHGAHWADALRPLVDEPALGGTRRVLYHRRGLGNSEHPPGPTSVTEQAEDAAALLEFIGIERAHVVGHSSGGMIALDLAARHPTVAASLVLLEPALLEVPAGAMFAELVAPLAQLYEEGDATGAIEGFAALIGGNDWREKIARTVPGGIDQAVKDAATFFEIELAAGGTWTFGREQASGISCPVLSVLGTATSPLFVESRELLHDWFPDCHDADIAGATHMLQMEAPDRVAAAIASFLAAT
jgi:pimeloyl-ACP methyl ester carboxylesterase